MTVLFIAMSLSTILKLEQFQSSAWTLHSGGGFTLQEDAYSEEKKLAGYQASWVNWSYRWWL